MNCPGNKIFINDRKVREFFYLKEIDSPVFQEFFICGPFPDDLFKMIYFHSLRLSDEVDAMLPPKGGYGRVCWEMYPPIGGYMGELLSKCFNYCRNQ